MGNYFYTTTTKYVRLDEHGDVELEFTPDDEDDILAERVGDTLVVAYRVHDSDSGHCNPLTDSDCQGDLYTKSPYSARYSSSTDNDSEFYSALGLSSYGEIHTESIVTIDGRTQELSIFASERVQAELEHSDWCTLLLWCHKFCTLMELSAEEVAALESEECSPQRMTHLKAKHHDRLVRDLQDENGRFSDRLRDKVGELYVKHWEQIAGPYVVPVASYPSNYETRYGVTTWDGDINDLPDGVWVACKCAISNIGKGSRKGISIRSDTQGWKGVLGYSVIVDGTKVAFYTDHSEADAFVEATYADRPFDVATAARNYAHGVLDEYSKWCAGEVYGCVVQTFDLKEPDVDFPDSADREWIPRLDHDSCWGFIGTDYAQSALASDYFEPAVQALQRELEESKC
jgi:hypothetical protein